MKLRPRTRHATVLYDVDWRHHDSLDKPVGTYSTEFSYVAFLSQEWRDLYVGTIVKPIDWWMAKHKYADIQRQTSYNNSFNFIYAQISFLNLY